MEKLGYEVGDIVIRTQYGHEGTVAIITKYLDGGVYQVEGVDGLYRSTWSPDNFRHLTPLEQLL